MFGRLLITYCFLNLYNLKVRAQAIPSDTGEFIISHGYKNETHTVRTEDGYYLTLHRITGKQNDTQNNETKPVVLIGHGMFGSSAVFVLAGPGKGLGYILSDEGYDVWLANFRGTHYSQMHDNYTIKSKEFWDFSWHEMGAYDLPAMIGYIVNQTGVEKIIYIGYSQGNTAYFVFSALHPEFADKHLHAAVALAPIVHLSHVKVSPVKKLSQLFTPVLTNAVGLTKKCISDNWDASDYFDIGKMRKTLAGKVETLDSNELLRLVRKMVLSLLYAFSKKRTDEALFPLIYYHLPDGSSIKQLLHYIQIFNSGVFQTYVPDIFDRNHSLIGPPEQYNLSRCKVKTVLVYGSKDWAATPKDASKLETELYSATRYVVDSNHFSHLDYELAIDVKELVYDKVVQIMRSI